MPTHQPKTILHGYNAMEGTFLAGCIFSRRRAGRAAAAATG